MQRTLALIKPDAQAAGHHGAIIARIQESGLRVVALKTLHLTRAQAEGFYHVHAERPFFGDLCTFMTEGKIVAMVLEGDDAIKRWRDLMGPTDATKAPKGTIRGDFALTVGENVVHGSDSPESAEREIAIWFPNL